MTDTNSSNRDRRFVAGMVALAALATIGAFGGVEAASLADSLAKIGGVIANEFFSDKWVPITKHGMRFLGELIPVVF